MVRRVTVDGAPVTATAAAFGYSRPAYYQAAAALAESGLDGLVPARPGPRGGHKLTGEILNWAEQQLAADPGLRPASLAEPIAAEFGCACTPGRSSARWPAAGSATPKAADLPAREKRKEEHPSLSLRPSPGPAAADRAYARMPARLRSRRRAGCPLRATASCRAARTRERVPSRALRADRKGHHRLAARPDSPGPRRSRGSPQTPPEAKAATRPQALPPEPVTTELIHALAGLAAALAGT